MLGKLGYVLHCAARMDVPELFRTVKAVRQATGRRDRKSVV